MRSKYSILQISQEPFILKLNENLSYINQRDNSMMAESKGEKNITIIRRYRIQRWARRCLSFGYIWSHALALYVTIICYLAYVNPIFYMKHFVNK